jgi:ribosomal-protein-alanine N-acetyltransferase
MDHPEPIISPRSLQTARLLLRPFAAGDWPAVNAMLSDADNTRHMHFNRWDDDRRRRWFEACVAGGHDETASWTDWVLERKDTREVIGWFGIGDASHPAVPGERGFGYLLDRRYWNRGYMTEALRAVLAHEFGTLQTPQVEANCGVDNPASWRVMEKCGMRWVKTVYDADFEGNWAHRHHYAISREEWLGGRSN